MGFSSEREFEDALVGLLPSRKGWSDKVLNYPTEQDLIDNWAEILFENNRSIDRLGDYKLTKGEMGQIIEQINELKTPLKLNNFINGKTITIKRDNEEDKLHFGKEVSLKIYDRQEIAGGDSKYQIARQPQFTVNNKILPKRRGDLMLLINGMPVIHIELKKSGVPISQACHQIEKYSYEGVFTGIFALVQIFVAMNPEETVYFANAGTGNKFNSNYFFHWADFNNEPINDWQKIAGSLLSIPMAHQLIGFYTVADNSDGVLKVMRSYQYYAANAISDRVSKKIKWQENNQLGGYIWHTTGSGKTMTSFKSAQLIANSNDADKVVFLTDRIELGTQSLKEYRAFADENESVQATEDTAVLVSKLKSNDPANTLIVTSIQKMSNIKDEEGGLNAHDIALINKKRLVFIVDEAHRSTFGDMLITIKTTFPQAIFFGFTGTPIHKENQKKMNTTSTVFGSELHRYSIADGIRDKNVLGFDTYKILTYSDYKLRDAVARREAGLEDIDDISKYPSKEKIYYKFMDSSKIKMAGYTDSDGKYVKGIEDYLPKNQYRRIEHQREVVKDIKQQWRVLSHNNKFHAIFATSSIPEAIEYYRLLKQEMPELKTTALFDPNIDNTGGFKFKEDGLVEIISDYNARYNQEYTIPTHARFKKDIALRLAHKEQYKRIDQNPNEQIDLLIVVDQMLTGFDSKWINTLYLDKMLEYENIIQAFSRTNRLFGHDKPFGTIRYYRKPHTMEENIKKAVKLYSGDRPIDLFVQKLPYNLQKMNEIYEDINHLFAEAKIDNFEKLPEDNSEKGKFASLFKEFNVYLDAGKVQGFNFAKDSYDFAPIEDVGTTKNKVAETKESYGTEQSEKQTIKTVFNEEKYLTLAQRYKELFTETEPSDNTKVNDIFDNTFEIDGDLIQIDTGMIDTEYMNTRFTKYLKVLEQGNAEAIKKALDELHKTFARLTQEQQKYANIFLHDVQSGDKAIEEGKTLMDYITDYQSQAKNDKIHQLAVDLGLDETWLRTMINLNLNEANLDEFGRFEKLKSSVDLNKAKIYLEQQLQKTLSPFKVRMETNKLLRNFILKKQFDK